MRETQLVRLLQELFPGRRGTLLANGDDAAVLRTTSATAVTVDTQTENVHFYWSWASARALGRRLVGVTLSDLAAVGALPRHGVLSLTVPRELSSRRLKAYLQGVRQRAAAEKFEIVGGDVTAGPDFAAVLTALGAAPQSLLRRDRARKGDWLCVTGPLGGAAFELRGLLSGRRVRAAHWLEPPSRLAIGRRLARTPGVHAAMDISDGLFLDSRRLAEASGLGACIELERIPVDRRVGKMPTGAAKKSWLGLVGGGEDYELLVCVDPNTAVPRGLTPIGRMVARGFSVTADGCRLGWPRAGYLHGALRD